ncbi:MAG: LuxR C-terminal-related transcriptional regulator [Chloroflexota bacterium]|nr:LuxR C-terminal-related transcriptional regulator [Actinomycetota bacterium]MDP9469521.1 LuxR C-terminal-related transcriptional regulator [Chloroflexota bacterium]
MDWAPVLSLKDGEAILEAKAAEARGEAVARAIEAYVTLAVALEPWIPKEAQRFRVKAKSIEIEQEQGQSEDPKLTPKEREVLRLLADGRSDAEICKRMHITANTLNTHIKNILGKLEDFGVETREQAVAYVWKHGITLP